MKRGVERLVFCGALFLTSATNWDSTTRMRVQGGRMRKPGTWLRPAALVLACLCAIGLTGLAPYTFGQTIDGNIVGTVFDATGAVVPGAAVTAENVATGVKSQATTSPEGIYIFNNVLVGTYNITAKKAGFNDVVLRNLAVELNKTTTANLTMKLGTVTTVVEVIGLEPTTSCLQSRRSPS